MHSRNMKLNDAQTQLAFRKVVDFFKGDRKVAERWFQSRNRYLNGKSPLEYIGAYRTKELNQVIDEKLRCKK